MIKKINCLLIVIFTLVFPVFNLCADDVLDESSSINPPSYFVDYVAVEEKESGYLASIYLTNGAHFLFFAPYMYADVVNDLSNELVPGVQVRFSTEYEKPFLRIYPKKGKHTYLVTVGAGAKKYLPFIVEIQKVKTGKFFSCPQVTLSDGSVWQGDSYHLQHYINDYWKVGDAVLYSGLLWPKLINVDASHQEFFYYSIEANQIVTQDVRSVEVKQIKGAN